MEHVEKKAWWASLEQIRETLYAVFFFFMPFTQALTFNIGFPLKISEFVLIILAFLYIYLDRKVQLPIAITRILTLFFFTVTLSLVINLIWHYPYDLAEHPTRFGYLGDSITRYIYFLLALCAFFISADIFMSNTEKFIKIWLKGAIAAAIYGWYLMLFSLLHLPVIFLPGMENPPQTIGNGIIRCGTFLEGNYMSLYLLISAGMSLYIKKNQNRYVSAGQYF